MQRTITVHVHRQSCFTNLAMFLVDTPNVSHAFGKHKGESSTKTET